jgi:hypothetical protein
VVAWSQGGIDIHLHAHSPDIGTCDAPSFLLASLMLMDESAESNLLTLVKPWSTWVITLKISPTIPNDPLDQVNTPVVKSWSNI